MINVILVDDEKPSLIELERLLKEEPDVNIICKFTDPRDAIENVVKLVPDVVFLDADMPNINALKAAVEIKRRNKNIEIIFVTSFNEYITKTFEMNSWEYLLIPVTRICLNKSLEKLRTLMTKKSDSKTALLELMKNLEKYMKKDINKITVWDDDEIVLLKPDDILYLEADSRNASIVTRNKKYCTKSTMEAWEEKLEEMGFFRCHRAYIINLKHINRISPMFNNYIIMLDDSDCQVPLSRTNVKKLRSILGF